MLNVDAKLFTTVLANHLNSLILSLVHGDQTGFMPGKGTDINIHRLYTIVDHLKDASSTGIVASLDAEKAFESVEWALLWQMLKKFGFGPQFIAWIQLLYRCLTASQNEWYPIPTVCSWQGP